MKAAPASALDSTGASSGVYESGQFGGNEQCKSPVFDESAMFRKLSGPSSFKEQMRDHFRNISMIMDCVACEKCRMWAKLETLGLATALKIVLAEDPSEYANLQRNEIIALINSLKQHAQSIEDLRKFNDMRTRKQWSPLISYVMVSGIILAVLRLVYVLLASGKKSSSLSASPETPAVSDEKKRA